MWGEEGEFIWQPSDTHWTFTLQATNSDSAIGNSFLVDGRNPTYGNPNAVLIKSAGLTAGGDLPGQSCVLISTTGMSPAEDPAVTAAYGVNPFFVPAGAGTAHARATQLSSHGVAYVNYGVCAGAANSPILNPLGYHYASAATDGTGSSPSGIARSLKGNSVPRLPPNTINMTAQYTLDLNGYTLQPSLNYYWQSGYNSRVFNDAVDDVGSWDQLNASLQLNAPDGHWYAKVYATNLMDSANTQAKALASDTSGNYTTVFLEDPRIVGFTVGANW
jgi:hypothetical protein